MNGVFSGLMVSSAPLAQLVNCSNITTNKKRVAMAPT